MALFSDDGPSGLSDWLSYDSKLRYLSEQEITSTESKSVLAKSEIESEVTAFLLANIEEPDFRVHEMVKGLVVTEPLKRWHVMHTLQLYYNDLASLQVNGAHQERASYYQTRVLEAKAMLFELGVGLVSTAVPQPGEPIVIKSPGSHETKNKKARTQFFGVTEKPGKASNEFWLSSEGGESIEITYDTLPAGVYGWKLFIEGPAETFFSVTPKNVPAGAKLNISTMPLTLGAALLAEGQEPERYIRSNSLLRLR